MEHGGTWNMEHDETCVKFKLWNQIRSMSTCVALDLQAFDASLASRSAEKQMLREAPPAELCEKLMRHFSAFQVGPGCYGVTWCYLPLSH